MKTNATLEGRSLLFNIIFVILNLSGLTFVVIGSHDNFENQALWMKLLGYSVIAVSTLFLFIFKGRMMMSSVSRVLVGGLFIVSGLVKANDPIGFAYKLEEYFEDGALAYRIKEWFGMPGFSLEFLIESALMLSIVICIVEVLLGILVIIGGKIKFVSYLMVFMMAFFTFLTWHTANCEGSKKYVDRDTFEMSDPNQASLAELKIDAAKTNKEIKIISKSASKVVIEEMKLPQCVNDCGCFGDAMKASVGRSLTPKESLWKDIVLFYLVLWIFISQWIIEPNTRRQNVVFGLTSLIVVSFFSWVFSWYFPIIFAFVAILGALWIRKAGGKFLGNYLGSSILVTILCSIFVFFVLRYEPMKDYRPYALGSNLKEKMNDGIEGKTESTLIYKNLKTGKTVELVSGSDKFNNASHIWDNEKLWKYDTTIAKVIIPFKLPSITDQFNPFLRIEDLTKVEREMSLVKELLAQNQMAIVHVKNLSADEIYDVPLEEFTLEEYVPEYYEVVDTVYETNPEFTEINIRDFIVNAPQIVILSSKNIEEANWEMIERYKAIYAGCKRKNIPFIILCSSDRAGMDAFRKKYKFDVPMFTNDETELKAIARSNPSMMILNKGVVVGKFAHRSTPTFDWLVKNTLKK